jgi:RNA polymerase sigma factor (sigma-70 family)
MANDRPDALARHVRSLLAAQNADHLTDRVLLQRFAVAGEEAAFAALVRRHGPMVLRVCRGVLHNADDAEDAYQATFLVLARKAAALSWQESAAGWLQGVAYRLALKARTAAARRHAHEGTAPSPPPPPGPLADISLREAQALLNEELNRLPDRLRIPLVLCYLEGATQDEAARQTGWSLSTLKRRLRRGRTVLEGRLRRRGLALAAILSAGLLAGVGRAAAPLPAVVAGAAALFRAGPTTGTASARAVALAEEALRSTLFTRFRLVTALLLTTAVLAVGVGLVGRPAPSHNSPEGDQAGEPAAPAEAGKPPRRDRHGDPLPPGALARLGVARLRHAGPANGVAFSPDGKLMASCGGLPDGTVRLWRTATGEELWRGELGWQPRAVAFSPDGQVVAVAGDGKGVCLCEAATGRNLRLLTGHRGGVWALAFTPDNKAVVSAGRDGTVRLWDRDSGKEAAHFWADGQSVRALAVSPDGSLLAAGCEQPTDAGDYPIRLWELPSGKERSRLAGHVGAVQALAFAPDGATLASGGVDGVVALWDVDGGRRRLEIRPRQLGDNFGFVQALAFAPGGETLACGYGNGVAYLCDPDTGLPGRRLVCPGLMSSPAGAQGLLSLAFAPDGRTLATGGNDQAIRLWDLSSGEERSFGGHRGALASVVFAPDGGTLATAGWDRTVRFWDVATGEPRPGRSARLAAAVALPPPALAFGSDGKTLVTGGRANVGQLWDVATGEALPQGAIHPRGQAIVMLTATSPGPTLVTTEAGMMLLWDMTGSRLLQAFPANGLSTVAAALAPDGRRLALGNAPRGGHVFDVARGVEAWAFPPDVGPLRVLEFSPDGRVLAAAAGMPGDPPEACAIRLWDAATGRELRHLAARHEGPVHALAFSPDGRLLASAGLDRTVRLWALATGEEVARFSGHQGAVSCLAFSPDGRRLASGSQDCTALIWDVGVATGPRGGSAQARGDESDLHHLAEPAPRG